MTWTYTKREKNRTVWPTGHVPVGSFMSIASFYIFAFLGNDVFLVCPVIGIQMKFGILCGINVIK
jgi:hypothetical protein